MTPTRCKLFRRFRRRPTVAQMAERIVDEFGQGSIHVGSPVRHIAQDANGVTVSTASVSITSRPVVVATNIAMTNFIQFDPILPPVRAQPQHRVPPGAFWRIWLVYDEAFWRNRGLNGEVNSIWINNRECGYGQSVDSPGLMAYFVGGDKANDFTRMTRAERKTQCLKELAHRFGADGATEHRRMRCGAALLVVTVSFALVACSQPTKSSTPSISPVPSSAPVTTTRSAQPALASDPAQLAGDLVADEQALRDPSSSEAVLSAAAHRQQAAYRVLARHPEWDAIARPLIPPPLRYVYDRNIDARVQLDALVASDLKDTLPAWRIDPPTPAEELLGYYREAQTATGVDWNYLAAINMIETLFGRVVGLSDAGAHGPMQFLPSTFAAYGDGGDILSPHDAITAAGRYMAANGFADDRDRAVFRYNNSDRYVQAVNDYAAVLATDPAAFTGYYRWNVYYQTTSGDVLLPIGYAENSPVPVTDYLATHPR